MFWSLYTKLQTFPNLIQLKILERFRKAVKGLPNLVTNSACASTNEIETIEMDVESVAQQMSLHAMITGTKMTSDFR